jgi:hypothetical protein
MTDGAAWTAVRDALTFAVAKIEGDPEPLNDRERADGNRYVLRMLAAVTQGATLALDPDRPEFLTMLDAVRSVGAAGADIDYDVAAVRPDTAYRVHGVRGDATYVGICVYAGAGADGASAIVASVDVDEVVRPDGSFTWEFRHPEAARVIVRQYFHDRAVQARGAWSIDRADAGSVAAGPPERHLMGPVEMEFRIANAARSLRWNAQLNELWTPELRRTPNVFVRQTADDIVAAIPNPDVTYSTAWWKVADVDEVVVIDVVPPETRYWSLQLCDRWFQCFPDRRANLADTGVVANADGSVTIVLADGDPGAPNWLDTGGHRTGVAFFRWLHADVTEQPRCRVVPRADVRRTVGS